MALFGIILTKDNRETFSLVQNHKSSTAASSHAWSLCSGNGDYSGCMITKIMRLNEREVLAVHNGHGWDRLSETELEIAALESAEYSPSESRGALQAAMRLGYKHVIRLSGWYLFFRTDNELNLALIAGRFERSGRFILIPRAPVHGPLKQSTVSMLE